MDLLEEDIHAYTNVNTYTNKQIISYIHTQYELPCMHAHTLRHTEADQSSSSAGQERRLQGPDHIIIS